MKTLMLGLLFSITMCLSSIFALPYPVEQELLNELDLQLKLYQEDPSSNERIFELSMSYAYTGQVDKGWELLKTIPMSYAEDVILKYSNLIKSDPTNWKYYFKIAFGYYFNKQVDVAIDQFQRVIKLNPENVWAYGFIALIYNEMEKPKHSILYCKQAIKIEPQATAIYALQGIAYLKQKKFFKAFTSYRKFKKLYAKH
tara:strand:+ start:128 stop:724 length:597 start_codon:yes stop_codon:yes gene_type:complete